MLGALALRSSPRSSCSCRAVAPDHVLGGGVVLRSLPLIIGLAMSGELADATLASPGDAIGVPELATPPLVRRSSSSFWIPGKGKSFALLYRLKSP
jgi:hypothetical protein